MTDTWHITDAFVISGGSGEKGNVDGQVILHIMCLTPKPVEALNTLCSQ